MRTKGREERLKKIKYMHKTSIKNIDKNKFSFYSLSRISVIEIRFDIFIFSLFYLIFSYERSVQIYSKLSCNSFVQTYSNFHVIHSFKHTGNFHVIQSFKHIRNFHVIHSFKHFQNILMNKSFKHV